MIKQKTRKKGDELTFQAHILILLFDKQKLLFFLKKNFNYFHKFDHILSHNFESVIDYTNDV